MNERALPRLGAILLAAAVAANLIAFAIGLGRGLMPPAAFDFGDSQHLERLSTEYPGHLLPLMLSLLSPVLAVPAGLAIFHVLRPAGWTALFGTVMFFVGMVFVVLLDIVELVAIARLAPAYGGAPDFARPAILAVGAVIDATIDVLGHVGHFFSFGLAQLAFAFAIVAAPGVPNWLGWLSLVPALLIGWFVPVLTVFGAPSGPFMAIAFAIFFAWLIGMAAVLWRWQPQAAAVRMEG